MIKEQLEALEAEIKENYNNIAGITVFRDGEMLYDRYFNECTSNDPIHIFSATKSIISLLIGIALDRGYIESVDQRILDFFPDYTVKKREEKIQLITLRNLLTMTAPYKFKYNPYTKFFSSTDWVKASLDLLGGKGEIGEFRYVPVIGPDILSGILTRVTGESVLTFAQKNLFEPLGISVERSLVFESKEEQLAYYKAKSVNGWVSDECGTNTAGWGLSLTPAEMSRIGQLCLNNGSWQGKQLVSPEWISESTREHSRWKKIDKGYGYLWWIIDEKNQSFAALGDGGNAIYVNPRKKMVISIASLFVPRVKDRMELIENRIEPLFD